MPLTTYPKSLNSDLRRLWACEPHRYQVYPVGSPPTTLTKRNLRSVCWEVERLLSYTKDFGLKKRKKEEKKLKESLGGLDSQVLSTNICLYPTEPGDLPKVPAPLRTNWV